MTDRTKLQREANELDLDMFNLARRLEAFAESAPYRGHPFFVADTAARVSAARAYVRKFMHPNDIKRTKEADEK